MRKTQPTEPSYAPAFLGKARQFLADADRALADSHYDSALLLSVHAAISAGDAVTVALGRVRSTDPDHSRAVTLLREVAGRSVDVEDKARQYAGLIGTKHTVEYESRRTRIDEAAGGVKRAERLIGWASQIVKR